ADTQCYIQGRRSGGNNVDGSAYAIAQSHDRALAVGTVDLSDCVIDRLSAFIGIGLHALGRLFTCRSCHVVSLISNYCRLSPTLPAPSDIRCDEFPIVDNWMAREPTPLFIRRAIHQKNHRSEDYYEQVFDQSDTRALCIASREACVHCSPDVFRRLPRFE